mmetsp:Transcript_16407/g.25392  ORF Transcript_16407/g.25392 Transcript_16407/m.25392 type:complete len:83 (+) Transcript_16407:3-251(+)
MVFCRRKVRTTKIHLEGFSQHSITISHTSTPFRERHEHATDAAGNISKISVIEFYLILNLVSLCDTSYRTKLPVQNLTSITR